MTILAIRTFLFVIFLFLKHFKLCYKIGSKYRRETNLKFDDDYGPYNDMSCFLLKRVICTILLQFQTFIIIPIVH